MTVSHPGRWMAKTADIITH